MKTNEEQSAYRGDTGEAGAASTRGRRVALALVLGFVILAGMGAAAAGIRGAVLEGAAKRAAMDAVRQEMSRLAASSAAPELGLRIVENARMSAAGTVRSETGEAAVDVVVDMPLVNRGAYVPAAYEGGDPAQYLKRLRESCDYAIEANLTVPKPEMARYQVRVYQRDGHPIPEAARLVEMIGRIAQDRARTWENVLEQSDAREAIADLLLPKPGTEAFDAFVSAVREAGMNDPDLEGRIVPLLVGIREVYEASGDGVEGFVFEQMPVQDALRACTDALIDELSEDLREPIPTDAELDQRLLARLMDLSERFNRKEGEAEPAAITYRLEDLYGGPMAAADCLRWVRGYLSAYQGALDEVRERAAELPRLVAKEPPKTAILSGKSSGQSIDIETRAGTGQHFLKFYRDGKCVMTVFLREAESLRLKLPAGSYRLRIGAGLEWYGETHAFYKSGVYREMAFKLRSGKGYTLTLDSDTANMETQSLNFAGF